MVSNNISTEVPLAFPATDNETLESLHPDETEDEKRIEENFIKTLRDEANYWSDLDEEDDDEHLLPTDPEISWSAYDIYIYLYTGWLP